ncbi:MAG: tRNA (adenosine(37)-N6)-threonylcarbamoyltransferase complex ATPase subunit type 1 TsaE [Alphaproteobacteria bacterium]|jgi:tRNA threonylcarbamoyladenosine biosynthesis protein TsaE|nr:tRNA (adenosine(37)-N6)-threonylcarbamoyltransferase complex ATPase subunit type 1 TsaE [Alphaproteobacteria bacterium]MBT7943939.1 tRNA (adenosine(37)-N6)-threonylcarbamoyltransferase complex ATPase subunit type 1 TsaE [Alphaproteobacteria bacterium]
MADISHPQITIDLINEAATVALAGQVSAIAIPGDTVALFGTLGSGKTVFARAFINARCEISEDVPSPTFTLVQTYEFPAPDGPVPVYHFDLYRIEDLAEIEELGMEDALIDGIALIEWPERLEGRLPANRLEVALGQGDGTDQRSAELNGHGSWGPRIDTLAEKVVGND